MFIKFCLHAVTCFQCLRKALDSARQYPVPNELCEICLPWATAPAGASTAALQDGTGRYKKGKARTKQVKENETQRSYYIFSWGKVLREKAEMLQETFQEKQINGSDG